MINGAYFDGLQLKNDTDSQLKYHCYSWYRKLICSACFMSGDSVVLPQFCSKPSLLHLVLCESGLSPFWELGKVLQLEMTLSVISDTCDDLFPRYSPPLLFEVFYFFIGLHIPSSASSFSHYKYSCLEFSIKIICRLPTMIDCHNR